MTAKIQPYGSVANESGTHNSYSHIIVYSDGSMMAVMPDGKWAVFASVPSEITFGTLGRQLFIPGRYYYTDRCS